MSDPIGTYSFLPWLRRGLMTAASPAAPGKLRATVAVDLALHGDKIGGGDLLRPIHRDIELFGPADVKPPEAKDIVRTEPRPWTTNFEPNYLPFIEFYDEGMPWLYTPGVPDGDQRLVPWLTLLVLTEDEFDEGSAPGKPLPYITVTAPDVFPPADGLWAWAHVHVDRALDAAGEIVSDDMAQVLPKFESLLKQNPDLGLSRLICPRKLAPSTGYHAFLIPTFESGRLAGLYPIPPVAPSAMHVAWVDYPGRSEAEPGAFPVYHRWYFSTATVGDFESLVRLLQPRRVPPKVGQRDMDTRHPMTGLPGIDVAGLHGVLRLGGALKVPDTNLDPGQLAEAQHYEDWDNPFPHTFQAALAGFVNLADDYLAVGAADPDPLITPPLYGKWHAQTSRLLESTLPPVTDNWVHELNLDPRFRVPAAFGTAVVQDNQEQYMAAAWSQIGDVLEANRRIRFGHLAREVAGSMHRRHLTPQLASDPARVLTLSAPVHRRLMDGDVNMATRAAASLLATGPLSSAMRRMMRPGGRLLRTLGGKNQVLERLLSNIAVGKAVAARPKTAPSGCITTISIGEKLTKARGSIAWRMLVDDKSNPDMVGKLPGVPGFRLVPPTRDAPRFQPGGEDSRAGGRYKHGLRGNAELFRASVAAGFEAARPAFDLPSLAAKALALLHPDRTVPQRVLAGLSIPPRFMSRVVEQFREVMAYPEIDVPMYKPLTDRSAELFVPNLNLIPPDTITLLETNQRFIEAYMVGLNHEMARELLWREYPTDQQGSYFRQFWDPTPQLSLPGETAEQRRERLRDIPPLHHWPLRSKLGTHDHREAVPGSAEEELVLVIRGELLKRYPTAVVYAQRAAWTLKEDGSIDLLAERQLVELTSAEALAPPAAKLRLPLYEAKVEPDIYFLGFDLTAEAARGGDPTSTPDPDPGWFFVIRERPGEARFGLDIDRNGGLNVWNDLAWNDVAPAPAAFIPVGAAAYSRILTEPTAPADAEKHDQWLDDRALRWDATMRASEVAYILNQAPMLVAVHAREMLGHG